MLSTHFYNARSDAASQPVASSPRIRWRMARGWPRYFLVILTGLGLFFAGCDTPECYSFSDCADGSTCCDGACTGVVPLPIGPAACTEGCACESFLSGDVERSLCYTLDDSDITQCTRTCEADVECQDADGLKGRCLELGETLSLERLCVWETDPESTPSTALHSLPVGPGPVPLPLEMHPVPSGQTHSLESSGQASGGPGREAARVSRGLGKEAVHAPR